VNQISVKSPLAGGRLQRLLRIPAVSRPDPRWHVSPAVDVAAYHFSWLWVLVPMQFMGGSRFRDYLLVYVLVNGVNFAHRHYGLPYAYLDKDVFAQHRTRLIYFPLGCLGLFLATPLVRAGHLGQAGTAVLGALVFFSVLWNIWHVYMQKFGILRVYMAKDPAPAERKTPPWVDRLFVFAWIPLYFSYLGPAHRQLVLDNARPVRAYTTPILGFMTEHQAWLVVPSLAFALIAVGLWLYHEGRAHRLRNPARLSAGLGMTLLSTSIFFFDPIKVYVAFGFSHAVEYMVFVWAFQRRRYATAEPSPMKRLLARPVLFYGALTVGLGAIAMTKAAWGRWFFVGGAPVKFLGMTGAKWFLYYTVFESLVHFYMDGFLWKLRRPEVRASL
jgi:hypothetical protein